MEIVIIGAGPGGYEAAIYAAKQGARVTLVEERRVGGTCLNAGCIPTKALLACGDALETVRAAASYGLALSAPPVPRYAAMLERKNAVVSGLVQGVEYLLSANGVTLLQGHGSLTGAGAVRVALSGGGTETLQPDAVILAAGSLPAVPGFLGYDGEAVITSGEALSLPQPPASILIVGGGVIGCELGQFLARLGAAVTIAEALPHLLPHEDPEVVKVLERRFRREKIKFCCGQGISRVEKDAGGVTAVLADGTSLHAEKLLAAIGRRPNTAGLGLEEAGIRLNGRGFVAVDDAMRTSLPGVYAIGDLVPTPQLAHVAGREGMAAVDQILGVDTRMRYHAVPRCVYTDPEVACVGLTEGELAERGTFYRTGRFDFAASGKARTAGRTDGFVKVLADGRDVLLGAAIVGAHATELLQTLTLAVELGLTVKQAASAIYPHPTLSEALMEALHDVHARSIHKP